jgi:hypothetical protein
MQLPRGTFHSIKKHVTFRSLLDEASAMQYTGSILVSFREGVAFLVLETGRTVLAAYQGMCGKEAFLRMEQMGESRVDAELTLLNESQLALAKEFNKSCRTHLESGSAVFFARKEQSPNTIEGPQTIPEKKTSIRPVTLSTQAARRTFHEGEVENLLSGDLDALDRMDLTKMSGKFRLNAKSIARELNLDHLGES